MYKRDPLSLYYDGYVSRLMSQAEDASRRRHSVRVWIASPRGEYAHPDRGGRTAHERAFTRAAYYLVFKNGGEPGESGWSLKLSWDEDDGHLRHSGQGRMARQVLVRLYPRGQARVSGPRWRDGNGRSEADHRIDQ